MEEVCILGNGAGAHILGALLTSKGVKVNIADLPQFAAGLKPLQDQGGVEIVGDAFSGFFKLNMITANMAEALKGADTVIVMARAQGHMPLIEGALPYLEDGQVVIVYTPFFTTLRIVDMVRKRRLRDLVLGEVQILPFSANRIRSTTTFLRNTKSELLAAAMPASDTDRLLERLKEFPHPPTYVRASNVLETTLSDIMPPLVVPLPLMNVILMEWKVSVEYVYGLTRPVGKVVDALDGERIAVGKALGLQLESIAQSISKWYSRYGAKGDTSFEVFDNLWTHKWEFPPSTMHEDIEHGEIAESVPYFIVPLSYLGRVLGVPTPTTDAIIQLAQVVAGIEYRRQGLDLEQMGLARLTRDQIIHYVNTGQK